MTDGIAAIGLCAFVFEVLVARARKRGKIASETIEDYLGRLGMAYSEMRAELRVLRRGFNTRRYGHKSLNADETQAVLRAFDLVGLAIKSR